MGRYDRRQILKLGALGIVGMSGCLGSDRGTDASASTPEPTADGADTPTLTPFQTEETEQSVSDGDIDEKVRMDQEIDANYLQGLETNVRFNQSDATISRTYEGEPGYIFNTRFTFRFSQAMYDYYQNKPRPYPNNFSRKYGSYVSTALDNRLIASITNWFEEYGEKHNHSESDLLNHVISFVHRLKYTDDRVGTGYNDYPKYPIETLVERGGDCEDTAILLASLLENLGYETRLFLATADMMEGERRLGHCAVGVHGDFTGNYFEDAGKRFFYIETTKTGYTNRETAAGKIGVDHPMERASVRPVDEEPLLAVKGKVTDAWEDEVTVSGVALNTSTTGTTSARVATALVTRSNEILAQGYTGNLSIPRWNHDDPSNSQSSFEITMTIEEEAPVRLVTAGYVDGNTVAKSSSEIASP